jgi:competence protein ComEA
VHKPSSAESAAPVNINVAGASELEKLPGVGKVIAERIISYRVKYGPFRRVEHLMMVHGVSDNKFREMRSLIVVE